MTVARRKVLALLGLSSAALLAPALTRPGQAATEEEAAFAARLLAAVPPHGERSLGRPDAPVVMVEYASATCPHCAEFHMKVLPDIKKTYIDTGKVRLIFREFPLDQRALAVFMLTRCVPEDKYFPTVDLVFRRQQVWNGDNAKAELQKVLGMAGISAAEFDACLKREDLAKAIVETWKVGKEQFGVKGTPTFFVNGRFVDGHEDVASVATAIEDALAAR